MRRSRHDGGKGDKPIAPQDQETFDNNWDQIFKAKKTEDSILVKSFVVLINMRKKNDYIKYNSRRS